MYFLLIQFHSETRSGKGYVRNKMYEVEGSCRQRAGAAGRGNNRLLLGFGSTGEFCVFSGMRTRLKPSTSLTIRWIWQADRSRLLCTGVCLPYRALTYALVCVKYYLSSQGDKGLPAYHGSCLQKPEELMQ